MKALGLALLLFVGAVSAQSSLPACTGSDVSRWTNCHGTSDFVTGHEYVGEWQEGKPNGHDLTHGAGVDAAIDYVGHGQTFQFAFDSLGVSGRAVPIGVGTGEIRIAPRPLMLAERVVTGSRHSTRTELIETMEIMARGVVKPVVGMRTHFTEVEAIIEAILKEKLLGRGALTYD